MKTFPIITVMQLPNYSKSSSKNGSSIIGKESGVGVWTEKQANYKGVIIREFWGVVIPRIFKVSL